MEMISGNSSKRAGGEVVGIDYRESGTCGEGAEGEVRVSGRPQAAGVGGCH